MKKLSAFSQNQNTMTSASLSGDDYLRSQGWHPDQLKFKARLEERVKAAVPPEWDKVKVWLWDHEGFVRVVVSRQVGYHLDSVSGYIFPVRRRRNFDTDLRLLEEELGNDWAQADHNRLVVDSGHGLRATCGHVLRRP